MVKKYDLNYNSGLKVGKHFSVNEFASVNGNIIYTSIVLIDSDLIDILDKLFDYMKAYKIIVTSGYRTAAHEKAVGNKSGTGYHVLGQAADINVWKSSTERFTAKEIVLALNDLGWNHGIGYITNTAVHVDTRDSKYWFDERYDCKSIKTIRGTDNWYDYFGIKKQDKVDPELEKAITYLSKEKIIDKDFWLKNYNTDLGKSCIKDLLIKFYKKICP